MKNFSGFRVFLVAVMLCSCTSRAGECQCHLKQATGGILCVSNWERSKQTLLGMAAASAVVFTFWQTASPNNRQRIAKGSTAATAALLAYLAYRHYSATEDAPVEIASGDEVDDE